MVNKILEALAVLLLALVLPVGSAMAAIDAIPCNASSAPQSL
jgi:hypothetical protein